MSAMLAAMVLFIQMLSAPFLQGTDAYYYALQCDWWVRTGELRIPDPSVLFCLMGILQRCGLSTETAVRLVEVVVVLAVMIPSLMLSGRIQDTSTRWIASAWIILCPSLIFVVMEFPKMGGALIFFPLAFWFLSRSGQEVWACGCLLLALVFHKGALPLVGLFAIGALVPRWKGVGRLGWVLGMMFSLMLLVAMGHYFSWEDMRRFTGGKLSPGVVALLGRDSLPVVLKSEILLGHLALLAATIRSWREPISRWALATPWLLLVPGWIPLGTEQVLGVGERYGLLTPLLAGWGTCFLLSKVPNGPPGKARPWLAVAGFLIVLMTAPFRLAYSHPARLDPDNASFASIVDEIGGRDIPMLICRQDLHFFYKFKTKKEAFSYEPEDHWDKRRIWRVACDVTPQEIQGRPSPDGPVSFEILKAPGYCLIREDRWDLFRSEVKWEDDSNLYDLVHHSWLNPAQKRPAFLYRKHQQDATSDFPAISK